MTKTIRKTKLWQARHAFDLLKQTTDIVIGHQKKKIELRDKLINNLVDALEEIKGITQGDNGFGGCIDDIVNHALSTVGAVQ